jgi:putative hydrolase of the HAD superfamily
MTAMRPILLLDLDDTLYEERSYVVSGLRAVAASLARDYGADPDQALAAMIADLDAHGRGRIFDRQLERLGVPAGPEAVAALVAAYREHRPDIALYPGVAQVLGRLRERFALALVTDGLAAVQRRKIAALNLDRWTDVAVCCWEHDAPKPAVAGYVEALRRLGTSATAAAASAVVIGDNPAHDMVAASALGLVSIRVRTGRFAAEPAPPVHAPTLEVARFTDVERALSQLALSSDFAETPR